MEPAATNSDQEPARRRPPRLWRSGARAVLAASGAVVLGVATVIGTAMVTAKPILLLVAGLVVASAVAVGGCRWAARGHEGRHRRAVMATTGAAMAVVVGGLALIVATPSRDPGQPAVTVEGERFWSLPTGSHLRYVKVPARGTPDETPVVFVHGGPGTPDMAHDVAFFGRLAADGFDVYVYDQIGAGGSARLADPEDYRRDRDVADLEAIRRAIGAQRMVLIGHSYGASVVAGYLAAYPDRVERTVFASPSSLDPSDTSGGNVQSRLDGDQRRDVYSRALRPRNLLVYTLLQVSPDAAHAVAGDDEMDAQNDRIYAASEPALHCPGNALDRPPTGLGFYRLQYPQSAAAPAAPDLRPDLSGSDTPALVIKGSCDYLSWSSAVTYVDTFSEAKLIYLRGGHNVHQDAPEEVLAELRAFLTSRPLPIAPYRGTAVPPDYEGPA